MELRHFGPTGIDVAVIGQGTWKVDGDSDIVKALLRGIELGMTHLDTAELYAGAEEILRPVVTAHRDDIFLVSKVLPDNAAYADTIAACDRSLQTLGVDHLDAYLLHWNGGRVPLAETMGAMLDLIAAGKIRFPGVSNFGVPELEEAQAALGDTPLCCNQVIYNPGDRAIEDDVLPWCEAHGVAVVGYSPFANAGQWAAPGGPQHDAVAEVASRHGRTLRQVVLRYLTRRSSLFAIPKASSIPHVEENAAGQGFYLEEEDLRALESAFRRE